MVLELFSKRNKTKKDHDVLPNPFRVQVTYLFNDLFGKNGEKLYSIVREDNFYKVLVKMLARDFGVFHLTQEYRHELNGYNLEFINGFLSETNTSKALDYIELAFRISNNIVKMDDYKYAVESAGFDKRTETAIKELNYRFDGHSLGYQFTEGQIIRRDNMFTTKRLLNLL